jgi:hypothetical protein
MMILGAHPFPTDIENMLREIDSLGRAYGRWALGENWLYSPREFDWDCGRNLDEARRLLSHLLAMLRAGRGDKVLFDPLTEKAFKSRSDINFVRCPQPCGRRQFLTSSSYMIH